MLEPFLLAVAFAVTHTQSPLLYSNQNQYFLHGAALAGDGHLANDWLATTRDPTPLFSALVAIAYAIHPWQLQPAYFALLMSYFIAVRWLVAALPGFPNTRAARMSFAALFTATHAAILRYLSVQVAGVDYPWYLQAGVAAQYLLGPGIQPSVFGVMLVFAVAAFAHGRAVLACVLAAGACWFHVTYLLPSALLVFGFLFAMKGNQRIRAAIIALAVAAPVVAFTLWRFDPFDADAKHAALILAHIRIPHHSLISRWFDAVAGVQLAWIALGLFLVRGTPFGRALTIASIGALLITTFVRKDTSQLALMFPWRITVLLVPVATAVLIAKLLAWKPPGVWAERGALAGLLALVAGGVIVTAFGLGYRMADESELYSYIRANAGPNDVYLLPVQFPAVASGRGAVSNTFAPPPLAKAGTNQIPVDLQRFRLATGARIYVDFKSVPYAAAEVIEWERRMSFASDLTANETWDAPDRQAALHREGITHIVWPRTKPLAVSYLEELHSDSVYRVYKVK